MEFSFDSNVLRYSFCFYILPVKRFFNQDFALNNRYSANNDLRSMSGPPMHLELGSGRFSRIEISQVIY